MSLPPDYLERVYAGVLGKLIGVYLGRPFEGWTYARIMEKLGTIDYYVHERLGQQLVVTDDDVAGTFTFLRALEDYGVSPDLSSEDIGKAWLNYLIEHRSILWWGGNGNSTEHTAWLNLKRGIAAPASGSIAFNGSTVAEQIGAQIFIDGWAMVAPGQPEVAARLARAAGRVSHDGESVNAAALWAAMEAEAFVSRDIDHLIDVGLSVIPKDSLIARLIADIRRWHVENADWRATRQLIEDNYGYDKFPGNCHVVPNHALMIMAVLYAPDDFRLAQSIVNTSGWDTDCNAGNVGCLSGLMLGLNGIEAGPDWRGPIADRLLISAAEGGNSINDAVRIAYFVANLGWQLAGEEALPPPKGGARFHFSLPGSVQGFRAGDGADANPSVRVGNADLGGARALEIAYTALATGQSASATTPTFAPPAVTEMRTYELMATPTLYPGQVVRARVVTPASNGGAVSVSLTLKVFGEKDKLRDVHGEAVTLSPGGETVLEWRVPEFDGQPIGEIGVRVTTTARRADGCVLVDWLRWDGPPEVTLRRPKADSDFWRMAWVNGVSFFSKLFPPSFRISQAVGEGMVSHGTREWTDYALKTDLRVHLGGYGGVAVRIQGLRRYYGIRLLREGRLEIVKVRDDEVTVLAEAPFAFAFEALVPVQVRVRGETISAIVGGVSLEAHDDSDTQLADGGIGFVIHEGALSADYVTVSAA